MEKKYCCHIEAEQAGYTVKQVMMHRWKLGTGQIKKAKFRKNGILVNGQQVTVRYCLQEGDVLEVLLEDKQQGSTHLIPMQGNLQILYEDDDILVVEKPAGIVCHPSAGHYCDSMANLLVGYFASKGEGYTVRLAGRLDKGTSGLLLYAKHAPALTELERQRLDGRMKKTYYAILRGCPAALEGEIEMPLGPDEMVPMKQRVYQEKEAGGSYAKTHYRILWKQEQDLCGEEAAKLNENRENIGTDLEETSENSASGGLGTDLPKKPENSSSGNEERVVSLACCVSLAEIQIETGRTHQIRAHMSWMGFPLVGDLLYGGMRDAFIREEINLTRPALHAHKISFYHLTTETYMEFLSTMPEDMQSFLETRGFLLSILQEKMF